MLFGPLKEAASSERMAARTAANFYDHKVPSGWAVQTGRKMIVIVEKLHLLTAVLLLVVENR